MAQESLEKKKVLIVDDDPSNSSFFEILLLKEGFDFVTVSNGKDALQLLKKESPTVFSLLVLDLMLPGFSGTEVLQELKKEIYRQVPILIVTARTLDDEAFAELKADPNVLDVLEKPIDHLRFRKKVREIIFS
ncbi:MAG: hypothetical protein A3I11_07800 [Elusimicrobia bacterium RIFCSPLOWO2_02_FULL_39_32]|nr:MAG: hypothetical protein A3B80_04805 [Elusimicrobia bacterium RIFCSPHIGHO2_02_FULL_39_36]OGR93486.1 MAG: hypothetical protein A3I11_07800 [Elusimicrobia bacterium RIFCSPLOWO2_02_FULL_39_32]OGS00833.1 MAG: hypothetical protein A3G85_08695 [Elusimicrobia bacterium RIFCSPLOWO2_12_FULL_39_28]